MNFKETIVKKWLELQPRERLIVAWGGLAVFVILSYSLILQPWHAAIEHMQSALPSKRVDLIWMRQQAELLKQGGQVSKSTVKGQGQSLLSVIEQTAKASGVSKSIKQMVPGESNQQVSVVLEEARFSNWLRWVGTLQQQYGVAIKQLTADREDDAPDLAEIRVTFTR